MGFSGVRGEVVGTSEASTHTPVHIHAAGCKMLSLASAVSCLRVSLVRHGVRGGAARGRARAARRATKEPLSNGNGCAARGDQTSAISQARHVACFSGVDTGGAVRARPRLESAPGFQIST